MKPQFLRQAIRRIGACISPERPPSLGEEGADYYDDMYGESEHYRLPYRQSHYYFLWAVIVDRVRRLGINRVLEVGCGPGQLAAFLMDQGLREYVGLDFSPTAIAMARRNAPRARFLVADACSPEVHAEIDYEAVICTEVLEHLENDLTVISRIGPGKRCLCSVPNFPYAGHVRYFQDAAQVAARYGLFFDRLDVMTFRSPQSQTDQFFLFEGVRNEYTHAEV